VSITQRHVTNFEPGPSFGFFTQRELAELTSTFSTSTRAPLVNDCTINAAHMSGVSQNAVRTALKSSGSEHAVRFASLMDNRDLTAYKAKEATKRKAGLEDTEYPIIGKMQSPAALRKPQSPKDLQEIWFRDLPEARKNSDDRIVFFAPRGHADHPTATGVEEAGMRTISALNDSQIGAAGSIVTFPSDTLDELCNEDWSPPENCLHAAMPTCTVLPNNTIIPLSHSNEGTTVMTLLSGSIVWGVWPSTLKNIRTLQTAYENFAKDHDEAKLDVASDLEGGLIFVQGEGEGLHLPPFSFMMGLTISISVLATQSHVTDDDFVSMLEKLPFLKAWFRTEVDGDHKQSQFNASIIHYLNLLLNGDSENEEDDLIKLPRHRGGLLSRLLKTWDDVKGHMAAMMGPNDREAIKDIWAEFLISAKGRDCRLCNKRVDSKKKFMKTHFIARHWPKALETEHGETKEVQNMVTEDIEMSTQCMETGEHEDNEDGMEVDE
jgi:hypothetical protein